MELKLNGGAFSSFIALPTEVVDRHLSSASGAYLKVLLLILRQNTIDTSVIASALSIPESDVEEAVRYWISAGILEETSAKSQPSRRVRVTPSPQGITAGEAKERAQESSEVQFLFNAVEAVTGSVLSSTNQRTLLYIHDTLGLSADVILMAVEYCVSIGKGHFAYIQKLCAGWADQGINTHEKAEEYLKEQAQRQGREKQVMHLFGMKNVSLTAEQRRYIDIWFDRYHFDLEMIALAYERTVNAINQLSFPYINSILTSWNEKGIRSPRDAAQRDAKPSRRNQDSEKNRSYDLDEFDNRGFKVPKLD